MYKLNKDIFGDICSVSKIEENLHLSIPFNPDNTDYQTYLRWLEEGNTPLPAEENQ